MKQLLLAIALIAAPVGLFAASYRYLSPAASAASIASLGDLADLKSIVADVQAISATGDLKKAGERVTDFETAWDDAQPGMRPLNPAAWGSIDDAADAALNALRASNPDATGISSALEGLMAKLDNPYGQSVAAVVATTLVDGVAISGPDGRPQPCEAMIVQLDKTVASAKLTDADAATVANFKSKALERCNADDDLHADEFSAHGIAIATR